MLAMEVCNFDTTLMKLSPLEFGYPQSRRRVYMLHVRRPAPARDSAGSCGGTAAQQRQSAGNGLLGARAATILEGLRCAVPCPSISAFLLPDNDPDVRAAGDFARGAAERQEGHELQWKKAKSAWVDLHRTYCQDCGIPWRDPTAVGWDAEVQTGVSPVWRHSLTLRERDILRILSLQFPLAQGSDDEWVVDVSQAVNRGRCRRVNVSNCLTPHGKLWCRRAGRYLLAAEKMALQGMPRTRYKTPESASPTILANLAGNAFNHGCVAAVLVSAFAAIGEVDMDWDTDDSQAD